MKKFSDILAENGIFAPEIPAKGFLRKKKAERKLKAFLAQYEAVEAEYEILCEEVSKMKKEWESYEACLKEDWDAHMIPVPELEESLKFGSLDEAIDVIDQRMAEIAKVKLYRIFGDIVDGVRTKWINELFKNAPNNSLVVIRDMSYEPYENHRTKFEEWISKKEVGCIGSFTHGIRWIICNSDHENFDMWCMRPKTTKVEFINA